MAEPRTGAHVDAAAVEADDRLRDLVDRFAVLGALIGTLVVGGVLVVSVLDLRAVDAHTLARSVQETIDAVPVSHPVTAVLLDFRAMDTALELVVLGIAGLAVVGLRDPADRGDFPPIGCSPSMRVLGQVLAPIAVLVGVYILAIGSSAPGGAFQGGAILASAVVIVHLAGSRAYGRLSEAQVRLLAVTGPAAFAASLVATGLLTDAPLAMPTLLHILALEAFATVSISVLLALLYVAAPPTAPTSVPYLERC